MKPKNSNAKIVTIPNLLSLFRLALIPVIVWLYSAEHSDHLAGYVLILSGLTDMVDGFIARRFHMISDLGKVLDPIADKLTQAAVLICLLLKYPLMNLPFVLMMVKELFMAVTGILIIRRTGEVLGAHWHGKAATCCLDCTMFLHIFYDDIPAPLSDSAILLSAAMIALSFLLYGIRNFRCLRAPKTA